MRITRAGQEQYSPFLFRVRLAQYSCNPLHASLKSQVRIPEATSRPSKRKSKANPRLEARSLVRSSTPNPSSDANLSPSSTRYAQSNRTQQTIYRTPAGAGHATPSAHAHAHAARLSDGRLECYCPRQTPAGSWTRTRADVYDGWVKPTKAGRQCRCSGDSARVC